jgi:hypothetical protein
MMGKVGPLSGGYSAEAHMPGDGERREQKSRQEKDRDGKEDMHALVRRITRGNGSCTLFDQPSFGEILLADRLFLSLDEILAKAV